MIFVFSFFLGVATVRSLLRRSFCSPFILVFPLSSPSKIMQMLIFLASLFLQYKKVASILSSHDPPIVLAKVDAMTRRTKTLHQNLKLGVPKN